LSFSIKKAISDDIKRASVKNQLSIVGRNQELLQIRSCLKANRNVLLEGPVGVGKTHLALAATQELGAKVFRIDGDSRYSEQKMAGWFDPPLVIKKGYNQESFIAGPLVEAMNVGGVLFINELNRLPEGVQNVLLPAIDERRIIVPRLGELQAKSGFLVIATQNPKEFVATSHLSEAILDRFELVVLDYASEEDEIEIVKRSLQKESNEDSRFSFLPLAAVRLIRISRSHPKVKRGASIRAAQSVAEIAAVFIKQGLSLKEAFLSATLMAVPTRIEIDFDVSGVQSLHSEREALLREWVDQVFDELNNTTIKKKT
jgi:MoxR-like ATPase